MSITRNVALGRLVAVSSLCGIAAVGVLAPSVSAATPHLSPASTKITGTSSKVAFSGMIDGFALTVNCTKFSATGTTPANGLTVPLVKPTFSGCTDSLGGKDTVITAGTWKLVANSTGTSGSLDLPIKAATFTSTLLSGCKLTVAPTKAAVISGKYNNLNTLTITKAAFPISGSGCSTSATATATTTVKLSPNVSVVG